MKGSPYPRSYYKCSHAGCNVKKIVERDPKTGEVSSAIAKVASIVSSSTLAQTHPAVDTSAVTSYLMTCVTADKLPVTVQANVGYCRAVTITQNQTVDPLLGPCIPEGLGVLAEGGERPPMVEPAGYVKCIAVLKHVFAGMFF